MEFVVGQIVVSKAGRDKADVFVVFGIEEDYLYLVDGKGRPLENPKKKKMKHVQPTKTIDIALHEMIMTEKYMKNADFRTALKKFMEKREDGSYGQR